MQESKQQEYCCWWSPSIGELEGTHQEVWGTKQYDSKTDLKKPCVFFGIYHAGHFEDLYAHKGKKYILWAGSDLRNMQDGLAFGEAGFKEWPRKFPGITNLMMRWIIYNCESWVENTWERKVLKSFNIKSYVCPSFLGDIDVYNITFKPNENPHVYLSASEGRQEEYGFDTIERIADRVPNVTFHLYGATWKTKHKNVIVHGRVSKDYMNSQIKDMQAGLRLNETDGFSEILAKAVLQGQYAIGKVEHPMIPTYEDDNGLILNLLAIGQKKVSNPARDYYRDVLNNYPWNKNRIRKDV